MAGSHLDIGRMIMQAQLQRSASRPAAAISSYTMKEILERLEAQDRQIGELIQAVQTLLDSNTSLGEQLQAMKEANEKAEAKNERLEQQLAKAKGKNASNNRNKYGKGGEKDKGGNQDHGGKTKEEREEAYIENEGNVPKTEPENWSDVAPSNIEAQPRDTSNRPDHYETMHGDILVEHYCDIEALSALGLTYIRDTRPVEQIDRISIVRHDRYHYVWVRDKDGNEFPYFIPKKREQAQILPDEEQYDRPRLVPHTSCTASMLSDLAVNRFQYALSVGREMTRMFNEKMRMAGQTVLNWLKEGGKFLSEAGDWVKRLLLKPGTSIYCDETWVKVKERGTDGKDHYVKRYMWVIVNLTTKVCYYLFGSRKGEIIQNFLKDFQGKMMTDAYCAYEHFNNLKDFVHLCCWAHVRRIFYYALKDYNDKAAAPFIEDIGLLYKVELENQLLHRDEAEIVRARGLEAAPVLNKLKQDAEALLQSGKEISSKLHQALKYMLNNWQQLIQYIKVGSVNIDNNVCERSVRPFTILRKNFGGFGSDNGAETTATYLTMVETCKLRDISPKDFFHDFFDLIVAGKKDYEVIMPSLLVKN